MKRQRVIIEREMRFGSLDGSTWLPAQVTIDTGSLHSQVSPAMAAELQAPLFRRERLLLADGTTEERDVVYVRLDLDPTLPTLITTAIVGADDAPLTVGALALEQLEVGIDPLTGTLVPELHVLIRQSAWRVL